MSSLRAGRPEATLLFLVLGTAACPPGMGSPRDARLADGAPVSDVGSPFPDSRADPDLAADLGRGPEAAAGGMDVFIGVCELLHANLPVRTSDGHATIASARLEGAHCRPGAGTCWPEPGTPCSAIDVAFLGIGPCAMTFTSTAGRVVQAAAEGMLRGEPFPCRSDTGRIVPDARSLGVQPPMVVVDFSGARDGGADVTAPRSRR